MKISTARRFAFSLALTTEEPHFNYSSFRVEGKIYATIPPSEEFLHIFVDDETRERILHLYPMWADKLMWGAKAIGLRVTLASAEPTVIKQLLHAAWARKAPRVALKSAAKP